MDIKLCQVAKTTNLSTQRQNKEKNSAPFNTLNSTEFSKNLTASSFGLAFKANALGIGDNVDRLEGLKGLFKDLRMMSRSNGASEDEKQAKGDEIGQVIKNIIDGKMPNIRKRDRGGISGVLLLQPKEIARPYVHHAAPLLGTDMPGMTRFEAFEMFEKQGGPEHTPIILQYLDRDFGVISKSDDLKSDTGKLLEKGGAITKGERNDEFIRAMACNVLGSIAPNTPEVINRLEKIAYTEAEDKGIVKNAAVNAISKIQNGNRSLTPMVKHLSVNDLGQADKQNLIELHKLSQEHNGDLSNPETEPVVEAVKESGMKKVAELEANGENVQPKKGSEEKVDVAKLLKEAQSQMVEARESYELKAPKLFVKAGNTVDVYADGAAEKIEADTVIMHGYPSRDKIKGGQVTTIRANNADILAGRVTGTIHAAERVRIGEAGVVNNIEFTDKPGEVELLDKDAKINGTITNCHEIVVPKGYPRAKRQALAEQHGVKVRSAETNNRNSDGRGTPSIHH